jgi:hypothetical protein
MNTYYCFDPVSAGPGALVIKFYHSGDQIRGYVREIAKEGDEDTVFPGEEMEPEAAFAIAKSHADSSLVKPVFIELVEGVRWDNGWGQLVG